jgi:hypothetical protein
MLSIEEYLLKAENYAFAAQTATTPKQQFAYIRAAAICRNKALRLRVGRSAAVLRRCPFTLDEIERF